MFLSVVSLLKINYLRIILFGVFAAMPMASRSETIDLVCVHVDGFSMNFTIDTSKLTVIYNRKNAHNVFIDPGSINFYLDLKDGSYYHMINRSSGKLTVRAPDGGLLYGYNCERAKPIF